MSLHLCVLQCSCLELSNCFHFAKLDLIILSDWFLFPKCLQLSGLVMCYLEVHDLAFICPVWNLIASFVMFRNASCFCRSTLAGEISSRRIKLC